MEAKEHLITLDELKELDELYDARQDMGVLGRRPAHWGALVEELRKLRRLVEAGTIVRIEGTDTVLRSWSEFYGWAHQRFHMLEDGHDQWIGDDN